MDARVLGRLARSAGAIPPRRWLAALLLAASFHAAGLVADLAGSLAWKRAAGAPAFESFPAYTGAALLVIAGITVFYSLWLAKNLRRGRARGALPGPALSGILLPTAAYAGLATGIMWSWVWTAAFAVGALVSSAVTGSEPPPCYDPYTCWRLVAKPAT